MQIPILHRRGQKKPWTSIPRINWSHPLTRGMIFYGYDTGAGLIVDLVDGDVQVSGTRPTNAVSQFGQGFRYTSGGAAPFFPIDGPICRSLLNSRYSIACAWYITALPSIAFTCPFGINDNASSNAAAFLWDSGGTTDMQFSVANTNPTPFTANSINKYHTLVGTNVTGVAQSVYYDGVLTATTNLTATFTTAVCAPCFNTTTANATPVGNGIAGWVYYGAYWNRTILAQEAHLLHHDPYCFLIYPEDEMFAQMVGVTAGPTTSEDQWHQGWSSVGRRYVIIGAG